MNKALKLTIFFLFLFISSTPLSAQDWKMVLEAVVTEDGKKLPNASVTVYKNGTKVETINTDAKGKASVTLDAGANYMVTFSSMGMITKKLNLDTRNVPPEDGGQDFFFPAEVDIFQKIPDLDIKILDQPIGIIRYNPGISNFDVDLDHTRKVKAELDKLQKEYEAKKAGEAANAANAQKVYDAAVKKADKFFASEQWKEAKEEYLIAQKAKPEELHPSFQLGEIQSKLIKQEQADAKYNAAMEAANKAYAAKDFQRAIGDYQTAKSLKPSSTEPDAKIKEIQGMLANQAKTEQDYLAAINEGDKALIVNNFEQAKTAFQKAAELKPSETYPKNKLAEINDFMAKSAAKDKEYTAAVEAGNKAIAAKDLTAAKAEFQKAQGLKPKEQLPQDKLKEIEGLMANQAKVEQNYLAAIQKAEDALKANQYDAAKAGFAEASGIKPSEEYPKNKIKEIDDYLSKQQAKEKEYTDAIASADKALKALDYTTAKTGYEKAIGIKPQEAYPKGKIAEIEGVLAANAKKEQEYTMAIQEADKALTAKNYEGAKTAYQKAGGLKPDEKYPKDKIVEIDGILAEQNKKNEEYQKIIAEGDEALAAANYSGAKTAFEKAGGLKPSEAYPKTKLKEIEGILAKEAANEKAYADAIAAGDLSLKDKKYDAAKKSYQAAATLKAGEAYPKDKISEIDGLLAEQAKQEQAYTAAIALADQALSSKDYTTAKTEFEKASGLKPAEAYPKDKLKEITALLAAAEKNEAAYAEAIKKGDAAFGKETYEEAKIAYNEALKLKPAEVYPKDKIAEVDAKIAAKQKELEEIRIAKEKEAAQEKLYQDAIAKGDGALKSKDYAAAVTAYQSALAIKANETYPTDKIKEAQTAIAALEKVEQDYTAALKTGDDALAASDFVNAKAAYNKALGIKPNEKYPKDKIAEADKLAANAEAAALAKAEAEKKDKEYQDQITAADADLSSKSFESAIKKYNAALAVKPNEQYPKDKIKEANGLITAAMNAKEAAANAAKKEAEYAALIKEGDAALGSKKFDDAKAKYNAALLVKDEQYPKDKIKEADKMIADELAAMGAKEAAEKAAKKEAEYAALIKEGDAALSAKKYDDAKTKYNAALLVKDDQYPKDKIKEADGLIAAAMNEKEAAKKEAEYLALVTQADGAVKEKKYDEAVGFFNKALAVKPSETYPQTKIDEINAMMGEKAAADAAKKKAAEQLENYNKQIAVADALLAKSSLEEAKSAYNKAIEIKSEDYPKKQIEEINARIAKLAADKEAIAISKVKDAKLDAEYSKVLEGANSKFVTADYTAAIEGYNAALKLKPNETYPVEQIKIAKKKQEEQLAEEARRKAAEEESYETKATYLNIIAKADQFFAEEDYPSAKGKYEEALTVMDEQYPKDQLKAIIDKKAKEKAKADADALAKADAAKVKAKLDQDYQIALDKANAFYDVKKIESALAAYEFASSLKPGEQFPKDRIKEIQDQLAMADAKAEEARLAKERQMAAKEQAAQNELAFNDLIKKADVAYKAKDFQNAKSDYQSALRLKPGESYPETQLKLIADQLDSERRLKEEEALRLAQEKRKQQQEANKINVSGKTEAEIEAMYREMWSKKNSQKAELKSDEAAILAQKKQEQVDAEEAKRQEELRRLQDITVSLNENKPANSERYLQNLDQVNSQADGMKDGEEGRMMAAKRSREEKQMELDDLQEGVTAGNEAKTIQNVNDNYEIVKANTLANEELLTNKKAEQDKRINSTRDVLVDLDQKLQSYRAENAKQRLAATSGLPTAQAEYMESFNTSNVKEANQIIESNQQKIDALLKAKEEAQAQYNQAMERKSGEFRDGHIAREKAFEQNIDKQNQRINDVDLEAFYRGEKRPRNDAELANKYSQGLTEEIIDGDQNSTTIRRIVVTGTQVDIYEKTFYSWGAIYYTKNGSNIEEEMWNRETKK
jgi:hypothetical protein